MAFWLAAGAIGSALISAYSSKKNTQTASEAVQMDPAIRDATVRQMNQDTETQKNLMDFWEQFSKPYEESLLTAQHELIAPTLGLSKAQLDSQQRMLEPTTQYQLASINDSMLDIDNTRAIKDALNTQQLNELQASSGLSDQFYKQAMEGVNVNQRIGLATSDVNKQFAGANQQMARDAGRIGINTNSSKFLDSMADMAMQQARAKSSAATGARIQAEGENFGRLSTGMQTRGNTLGLQSAVGNAGSQSALGLTSVNQRLTDVGVSNHLGSAAQFGSLINNNLNTLANNTRTQTNISPQAGMMDFIGNAAGTALGSYASAYGAKEGGA